MLLAHNPFTCPACGGFIGEAAPLEMVKDKVARGQQSAIFDMLVKRMGRPVSKVAMMGVLFEHRADGGPMTAERLFSVQIANLRRAIGSAGWSIIRQGGGRGSETFYRLIPTEAGQ